MQFVDPKRSLNGSLLRNACTNCHTCVGSSGYMSLKDREEEREKERDRERKKRERETKRKSGFLLLSARSEVLGKPDADYTKAKAKATLGLEC